MDAFSKRVFGAALPGSSAASEASGGNVHAAAILSIVKIQRAFRTRQAAMAKVTAQEEARRESNESRSAKGPHLGMDASDFAKLRQERQEEQPLTLTAGVGSTGTLVWPINYDQYNMQRDFLGDDPLPIWARLYRGQLHPYEPARVVWDSIMLLLVCWSCLFDPYKAAFLEVSSSPWDWFIDMFYWVDILLSFSTGFETEGGVDVGFQRSHVVKYYLTRANGFWIDLIATIPWDVLVRIFEPSLDLRPATYRIIRMVRLLRLLRAPRLISRLTEHRTWAVHSATIEFIKFTVYVLLMAHALACVFFLWPALFVKECSLLTESGFDQHDSQKECTPLGSWRDDDKVHGAPVVYQYVWALYWSVTTITTIGFGDITPLLQVSSVKTDDLC